MDSLFLLLPISLLFFLGIGAAFWWAIFTGQLDDTQDAATAILDDDDQAPPGQIDLYQGCFGVGKDGLVRKILRESIAQFSCRIGGFAC